MYQASCNIVLCPWRRGKGKMEREELQKTPLCYAELGGSSVGKVKHNFHGIKFQNP